MFENIETGWFKLRTDYPSNYQFFHLVSGMTQEAFDSLKNQSDGSEPKITINGSEIACTLNHFERAVDRKKMVYLCFDNENDKFQLLNSTQYRYLEENKKTREFNLRYKSSARLGSSDKLQDNQPLDNNGFSEQMSKLSDGNDYKYSSELTDGGQIKWLSNESVHAWQVAEIVQLYAHGRPPRSLIVNTGTHGNKHGITVVQNPSLAESKFTLEDITAAWDPKNVSLHIVSRGAPPLSHKHYPHVDIIDAWCFSANQYYADRVEKKFKRIFSPSPESTPIAVDNSANQQNFANQSFGNNPQIMLSAPVTGNSGGTNVGNQNSGTQQFGDNNIVNPQQPRNLLGDGGSKKRDLDTTKFFSQCQPERKKQKSRNATSKTDQLRPSEIRQRVIACLYNVHSLTKTELVFERRIKSSESELKRFREILAQVITHYNDDPKSFLHEHWTRDKIEWEKIVSKIATSCDSPDKSNQVSMAI